MRIKLKKIRVKSLESTDEARFNTRVQSPKMSAHLGRVDAGRLGSERCERRVHLVRGHVGGGLIVERRLVGVHCVDPVKDACRREVLDDRGALRGRVRIVVVGQREDVKDETQIRRLAGRVVVGDDCGVLKTRELEHAS